MKKYFTLSMERSLLLTLFVFTSIQTFAQDKGLDIYVDINKNDDVWLSRPWVWVVGAAVLILVAPVRGGEKIDFCLGM